MDLSLFDMVYRKEFDYTNIIRIGKMKIYDNLENTRTLRKSIIFSKSTVKIFLKYLIVGKLESLIKLILLIQYFKGTI